MRVKIEVQDKLAFSAEDARKMYSTPFSEAKVEILPDSDNPEDFIYFGVQSLYSIDHLDLYYEFYPHLYEDRLEILKQKILGHLSSIVDKVIKDNELKLRE